MSNEAIHTMEEPKEFSAVVVGKTYKLADLENHKRMYVRSDVVNGKSKRTGSLWLNDTFVVVDKEEYIPGSLLMKLKIETSRNVYGWIEVFTMEAEIEPCQI
jgi:hypothetical protein